MIILFSAPSTVITVFGGFFDSFLAHDAKDGFLLGVLFDCLFLVKVDYKRVDRIASSKVEVVTDNGAHNKVIQDKNEVKNFVVNLVDEGSDED